MRRRMDSDVQAEAHAVEGRRHVVRQLRRQGLSGSAVVMLDGDCAFLDCPPQTRIWWGAYLGTADEILISGEVGEVGEQIVALRADARARIGWIMDTYLLRA